MIDPNGYFNSVLAQKGALEFIEMDQGKRIAFQKSEENNFYSFLVYDIFQFDKIEWSSG